MRVSTFFFFFLTSFGIYIKHCQLWDQCFFIPTAVPQSITVVLQQKTAAEI